MREEQLKEDIAMTPLERLTLAFKISDFARELRADNKTIEEESSSIPSVRIPPRALYKLVLKQRKPAVKQAFFFAEEEENEYNPYPTAFQYLRSGFTTCSPVCSPLF